MSKPKNSDRPENKYTSYAWDKGYSTGLRDGAARERRALERWLKEAFWGTWMYKAGINWLASRKGKK